MCGIENVIAAGVGVAWVSNDTAAGTSAPDAWFVIVLFVSIRMTVTHKR